MALAKAAKEYAFVECETSRCYYCANCVVNDRLEIRYPVKHRSYTAKFVLAIPSLFRDPVPIEPILESVGTQKINEKSNELGRTWMAPRGIIHRLTYAIPEISFPHNRW